MAELLALTDEAEITIEERETPFEDELQRKGTEGKFDFLE